MNPTPPAERDALSVAALPGGSESETSLIVDLAHHQRFVRKEAHDGTGLVDWPEDQAHSNGRVSRLRRQVRYLQSLPLDAAQLFPRVLDVRRPGPEDLRVELEYIEGPTISQLARTDPELWPDAVEEARKVLQNRVHCHWRTPAAGHQLFQYWHLSKIVSRFGLASAAELAHRAEGCRRITVNGRRLLPLHAALDQLSGYESTLSPDWLSMVVGDTNTHNILIDDRGAGRTRFVDPRGVGVLIDDHIVDDPLYDWKFWHNSLGHYDALFEGQFELEEIGDGRFLLRHTDPLNVSSWSAAHRLFLTDPVVTGQHDSAFLGRNALHRLLFLMGSHFVAMMPFHLDRYNQHGTCVADPMYLEALFWFDLCLESLRSGLDMSELTDLWLPAER